MKIVHYSIVTYIVILCLSCSSDDDTPVTTTSTDTEQETPVITTITTKDFEVTIDENPAPGFELGMIEATTNQGTLVYSLKTEEPTGAFAIDASTGKLTVKDATLFDYETRTQLTATATLKNGDVTKEAKVNVTLNDIVAEVVNGNIQFPDVNFKNALLAFDSDNPLRIDTNNDREVSVGEAEAVKEMNIRHNNISDLSGIEYFTALEKLNCSNNDLITIDVSRNIALTELTFTKNAIINVDMSHNTALTTLTCGSNPIENLDVSKNTALRYLDCSFGSLTTLDISNNIALIELRCNNNQISILNITPNKNLTIFECNNNVLNDLNMKNGNNVAFTDVKLGNNAPLQCIQVDDPSAGYLSSWIRDKGTNFSSDCSIR
ncbi:cadherin repeat domain-containing protein [Aquimarina mytili]|uniref:Cadherin domain-containing protein n=1 Tax=Aquimarina mytili TaxID=874423 RepID=A0A937A3W4_9FLAO|nr:cadherin repeat domain-containing protein [Aquimarina mytili]MBL0683899.1 hypothetical protein [Aquimarina mytili]